METWAVGGGGGGGLRYIKCFYWQFSYFNRKKGSRQKGSRVVGEDSGVGEGPWVRQWECLWNSWIRENMTDWWVGRELLWWWWGLSWKNKKAFEWNLKKNKKKGGLNPGWGWTCHREGFFGCLRHLPMIQRVVTSLAAPAPPAQHLRDTLDMGGGQGEVWDMANSPFNSQVVCTGLRHGWGV